MFTLPLEVDLLLCDLASPSLKCEAHEGLFCELHALSVVFSSIPL